MRRLVLHIGYPKTGTSTLQRFLFTHRARLSELGVLYPMPEADLRPAQHNLAWSLSTGYRFDPGSLTFENVADQLRAAEQEVVVISSEDFVQRPDPASAVERVRAFAEQAGVTLDVVAFVRPQHAYINSLYTQRTKFFNEPRRFRPFVKRAVNFPLLDYSAHLEMWDRPPAMRLIPLPFTPDRLAPSLESVFCEAAGLADRLAELLGDAEQPRMNTAPGPLTVEVCRRIARYVQRTYGGCRDVEPARHSALSRDVIEMATRVTGEDAPPFNGLDNDLRERIDEGFATSNDVFAQRYWGAPWREVFAADYERDLVPNEYDRERAQPKERQAVRAATRSAVVLADSVLAGSRSGSAAARLG